ncbi:Alpha-1,2-mannosyltransferase MNN21 [Candida viswanathii]|uniref:Alpha-1,2-mannosyltransferase MNN21 n=1 Tax=Candida viswanathii TaxID=5486 RepID=A0A367XZX5_9ASCO|nr:Alpha-1,2-mannosyltransferase MNN21 [Candida viswanathii]
MFEKLIYRLRLFRRRNKYTFLNAILLLIVILYVLFAYINSAPPPDNSAIINEKGTYHHSVWDNVSSWFTKTKPFLEKKIEDQEETEVEEADRELDHEDGSAASSDQKVDIADQENIQETDDIANDDDAAEKVVKPTKEDEEKIRAKEAERLKLVEEYSKVLTKQEEKFHRLHPYEKARLDTGYLFFDDIFKIFHLGNPKVVDLNSYISKDRIYHARYDTTTKDETVFSEKYLSSFLHLNQAQLAAMKKSHLYVVDNLPEHAPDKLYKKNGIVFVAGGHFNWLTLLSIRSLRAVGCHLPIEVFIPKIEEYEPDFCGRMLPELDARCVYMKNRLFDLADENQEDKYAKKFEFKGYQYKALAILLSSFENVLLLDSDNIPAHNPESLFESDPFKSYGLVVWPDYWKRATSPYYYDIAGITISKTNLGSIYDEVAGSYSMKASADALDLDEIPLHQRLGSIPDPTSESGQLLISKKTHLKPLLLALYYNLYGPSHYYPLFSQGSDGEGDKETFLAATVTLGKKFYQVSKFLVSLGHFKTEGGEFEGCGMGQHDPAEDLEYIKLQRDYAKIPEEDTQARTNFKLQNPVFANGPKILFVHANFPKLNPWKLKQDKEIFSKAGERLRLYGPGMTKRIGYDFEWFQWESMKLLLCIYDVKLEAFKDIDRMELCDEILAQLRFLNKSK